MLLIIRIIMANNPIRDGMYRVWWSRGTFCKKIVNFVLKFYKSKYNCEYIFIAV